MTSPHAVDPAPAVSPSVGDVVRLDTLIVCGGEGALAADEREALHQPFARQPVDLVHHQHHGHASRHPLEHLEMPPAGLVEPLEVDQQGSELGLGDSLGGWLHGISRRGFRMQR